MSSVYLGKQRAMAFSLNKVMLIGNCADEPSIRAQQDTYKCVTFSMATNERRNDTDYTEWHNIVAWNRIADIAERFIHKGSKVYVEGKIRRSSYQDKTHPDVTRYRYEIYADNIILLDRKGAAGDDGAIGEYAAADRGNSYQSRRSYSSYQGGVSQGGDYRSGYSSDYGSSGQPAGSGTSDYRAAGQNDFGAPQGSFGMQRAPSPQGSFSAHVADPYQRQTGGYGSVAGAPSSNQSSVQSPFGRSRQEPAPDPVSDDIPF